MIETILISFWGVLMTLLGLLIKHCANSTKHPDKKDIVFKDVCTSKMDCVETKIDALKELCETRFDNLENLIKNKK